MDFLEQYIQNELPECDFLEQQAKLDYDHKICMINTRREYAKSLERERNMKIDPSMNE